MSNMDPSLETGIEFSAQYVSGITFVRYAQNQMIGKPLSSI